MGSIEVFVDAEFNIYKPLNTQEKRDRLRRELVMGFEGGLNDAALERYVGDLGDSLLYPTPFLDLFFEARQLYRLGIYFSCVCTSATVAEKIGKHVLNDAAGREGDPVRKQDLDRACHKDRSHKERIDALGRLKLVPSATCDDFEAIRAVRNGYIHADAGKQPENDAPEVIRRLAAIVTATASVFKDYKLGDGGRLVRRTTQPPSTASGGRPTR
jgi:hypothetical protein